MTTAAAIYLFCLLFGLGLAFISGFFGMIFGGDLDAGVGDVDAGIDVHADGLDVHADGFDVHADAIDVSPDVAAGATLGPVSGPIISTLMTAFGGVGLICTMGFDMKPMLSVPISFVTAIGVSTVVFIVLSKFLMAIQGTSHSSLASLVGTEGQVVTPIPAEGVGEVAYSHAGVREKQLARSEESVMIPHHSLVRVTRVAGSTLIVRELVDEKLRRLKDSDEEAEPAAPGK